MMPCPLLQLESFIVASTCLFLLDGYVGIRQLIALRPLGSLVPGASGLRMENPQLVEPAAVAFVADVRVISTPFDIALTPSPPPTPHPHKH